MTKEKIKRMITARINTEYRKYHGTVVDFMECAAIKIVIELEHDSKQGETLPIDSVSHQRGLLESFRDWLNNTKTSDNNINNGDLDDFLEDYNCG